MAARCWGYEEDGTSNGKCKKTAAQCRFSHPDSEDWKLARRLPNKDHRKSGSFTGSSHGRRDSDSWKSTSDAAPTSTNTIKLPETGSRWGNNASSLGDKPQASGSNTGWPKASSGETQRSEPTAWNINPESVAWGKQNTTGGWGNDWEKAGTQNADNPWAGANSWSDPASEWGSGTWTGEISTHDKGKGKAREEQDVPMREPTPPRKTLPVPHRTQSFAKPDTQLSELESRKSSIPAIPRPSLPNPNSSRKECDKDKLRTSSTPTIPRPPVSIPNTSKKGRDETPLSDLQAAYKELVATNKAGSRSSSYPLKYTAAEGRVALYTDILTCMQDVVIAQIVQQDARRTYDRWKHYHDNSPTHAHASLGTRKMLEEIRAEYYKKLTDAIQKRDLALQKLGDLPDLVPNKPVNDPAVTKEMVMKYTDELRSWFLDLKLHERLAVEKKEKEIKAKSLDSQNGGEMNAGPQPLTAEELLKRGNWDWKVLKAALKLAEASVDNAAEQVYSSVWTNHDSLDENLRNLPEIHQPMKEDSQAPSRSGDYATLENKMKSVDENLAVQSEQAAFALTRVHDLQYELDGLRAESTEINRLCEEAEQQFVEFDRAKDDLHAEIESLTAQLQVLHQHQWSSARPSSSELLDTSVQPILNELLPHFQKRMEDDMRHILDLLRQRGLENQEEVGRQVEEMLKPLLTKTDEIEDICQTFMAMGVAQDPASATATTSTSAPQ